MDKERQSERTIAKRLGKIQKQLKGIELRLSQSRLVSDDEPPQSEFEGLRSVLDQLGERIDEHLGTWSQERDRVESRLRTLERAIADKAPLFQELQGREAAFRQAAPKASAATNRPAPDYVPVLTAAIQLMRDVGVCVIERCWTPEQKPSAPSKGA